LADLICIGPAEVAKIWPHVVGLLRRAIAATELSDFGEFETDVIAGRQLLWIAWDGLAIEAAATTHLSRINGRTVCTITACAGRVMDQWLPLLSKIEDYAKAEGAGRMRIYGRKGWVRVLDGYKAEFTIMEKGLT
jgi:hypothetical protein